MQTNPRHGDVIKCAAQDVHVKGHGKNFQPLIAAGSWTICGFRYGKSQCACCGRPIVRTLQLKNQSHRADNGFSEVIEVGVVCGPKVFLESCIGFYSDPAREWERQHQAWKDFINYVILCVKHEKMWSTIPQTLRSTIDGFLQEGYKSQEHSGGWWMVKDAKKKFLKSQRNPDVLPPPKMLFAASRGLMYSSIKQGIVAEGSELRCSFDTGEFSFHAAA